jgi:hypothetical protein
MTDRIDLVRFQRAITTTANGTVVTGITAGANGSTSQFVLDSAGNVGVGTASPAGRLNVATGRALFGPNSELYAMGVGFNQTRVSGGQVYYLGASDATSPDLVMCNAAGLERMRIDASGRVTKPFLPAFLASNNSGTVTVNVGSYFPFNVLHTAFAGSNRNSGYNTSTFVYTAPVAGLYQFYVQYYINALTQNVSISWWRNGAQMNWSDAALAAFLTTPSSASIVSGSVIMELAANDFVGTQPRTGASNISFYGGHSAFWGRLIG